MQIRGERCRLHKRDSSAEKAHHLEQHFSNVISLVFIIPSFFLLSLDLVFLILGAAPPCPLHRAGSILSQVRGASSYRPPIFSLI